jgi:hypothetical protein
MIHTLIHSLARVPLELMDQTLLWHNTRIPTDLSRIQTSTKPTLSLDHTQCFTLQHMPHHAAAFHMQRHLLYYCNAPTQTLRAVVLLRCC